MSLRDDLNSIQMTQTKQYKEESPNKSSDTTNTSTTENKGASINEEAPNKREAENPFNKARLGEISGKRWIQISAGVLIVVVVAVVIVFAVKSKGSSDEGADFLAELEAGAFSYTVEERETLRDNGYTADDIERYEADERDPYSLVQEAEQRRQEIYDEEVKPILDGASPKYKALEKMTWLGTGVMSQQILNNEEGSYEERYGTYNTDYIKVDPHGSQLFIKLTLKELNNQDIFMTLTPSRFNELDKSGNIVVVIEYNKYADGSILVTDVQEKDIRN